MDSSIPLSLVAAWVLLFGFVNTHQRHAMHFGGTSQGYRTALHASVILGSVAGLGLLGFYFTQTEWYWPIVLFVLGSVVAAIVFGLLEAMIGQLAISVVGFVGWPAAALWFFVIIDGIRP